MLTNNPSVRAKSTFARKEKDMNKAILMGRLTRDPDVHWTQGQDQKCIEC